MSFRFVLSSPDKNFFNGPAESVVCPGPDGYFGIMARHAPMVAAVGLGIIKVTTEGSTGYFVVDGGVAEVTSDEMMVVADMAIPAADPGDAEQKLQETKASRAVPVTIH